MILICAKTSILSSALLTEQSEQSAQHLRKNSDDSELRFEGVDQIGVSFNLLQQVFGRNRRHGAGNGVLLQAVDDQLGRALGSRLQVPEAPLELWVLVGQHLMEAVDDLLGLRTHFRDVLGDDEDEKSSFFR